MGAHRDGADQAYEEQQGLNQEPVSSGWRSLYDAVSVLSALYAPSECKDVLNVVV